MANNIDISLEPMQSLRDRGISKLKNTCGGKTSKRQRGLLLVSQSEAIVAYGNSDVN